MSDPGVRTPPVPEAWHVGRTMRVLELLAFAPLSAPQLASAINAQPRTVRRVLTRLADEGYVQVQDDGRRAYEPTMRLVALAGQIVERSGVVRAGRPYVALLHEQTGSTVHLVVPSYESALCLAHASREIGNVRPYLRELVPAHCTASGKALLAWRERWRESVLGSTLERFTDATVVDPHVLRRTLEHVRSRGYATEDSEYQPGIRAVAIPLVVGEEALAALSISGPDLDVDAVLPALQDAAQQLVSDLSNRSTSR